MKSIGFTHSLPIESDQSLFMFDADKPQAKGRDLLVQVEAISVNPADAKRRTRTAVEKPHETPLVLGYDAVGQVIETGDEVSLFQVGDTVWYAGDASRQGSNSELQLVDERIVGQAPTSVSVSDAAALPLTGLTAWEMLFDRFNIEEGGGAGKSLLVIGGAGGVGSITIQLARQLTDLNIIATASRPATVDWCKKMGAHTVVNHQNLVSEMCQQGYQVVEYIAQYADTAAHWDAMVELIAPQGKIGTIVETGEKIDISMLQGKSVSLHWELMFTRALFKTHDMIRQHEILNRLAELLDAGTIQSTRQQELSGFTVETLKQAHQLIEAGDTIGKLVVKY